MRTQALDFCEEEERGARNSVNKNRKNKRKGRRETKNVPSQLPQEAIRLLEEKQGAWHCSIPHSERDESKNWEVMKVHKPGKCICVIDREKISERRRKGNKSV